MRRIEGRMNLAGGIGLRSVEAPGTLCDQVFQVLEHSPLKVTAQIAGGVAYHVEAGLVELRNRYAGRRVVALLPQVKGLSESLASILNALAFADVTIIADDECADGRRLAEALVALGCDTQLVTDSLELEHQLRRIERMADVLVWIGADVPGTK